MCHTHISFINVVTQINRLEGKSLFKKFIDTSCLVFSPSSSQRYCPSEYICSEINWICVGVYLKTTSLLPPNPPPPLSLSRLL